MKKRIISLIFLTSILVLTLILFSMSFVSAESNVCCEKLKTGQFCQNAPIVECDTSFETAPTSCESTNFCSVGTCIDSQEGLCEGPISKNVCNNGGGVWDPRAATEVPQCNEGCCIVGDGAFIATQTRCKKMASDYGTQTNFNPSITSEVQCSANAGGDIKGACTFEKESAKTCKLLTKTECNSMKGDSQNSNVDFFEGILCSDETLGTNCGPTEETTCVPGQDEVYFVDSCGNLANVYDFNKIKDKDYWSKIVSKEDSCNAIGNNANSLSCGNCNYPLSTCLAYKRGETSVPNVGNYICKDLGCTFNGVKYRSGESWCGLAPGTSNITDKNNNGSYLYNGKTSTPNILTENLPGSIYERLSCYNGEISIENCYDGRQKVCVQDSINGIKNAACTQNLWKSCYEQTTEKDCMERSVRKCTWVGTDYSLGSQKVGGEASGACYPLNSPGFDFWAGEGNGDAICSYASISCDYEIEKNGLAQYSFKSGSACINGPDPKERTIKASWANEMNSRCIQVGDCGPKLNYLGQPGDMQVVAEKVLSGGAKGDILKSDGKIIQTNRNKVLKIFNSWKDYFNRG